MKRTKIFSIFVVMILLAFLTVSCGEDMKNSLDNITVNFDSQPEFVLKNSDGLSDEQLSKDKKIRDALNKAISDYPKLSTMLEADMIDGGNNNYISEDSEPFFKKLNEFINENYKKAKSMFPEITEDEFYYSASVGYMVANSNAFSNIVLKDPRENLSFEINIDTEFDKIMTHGFWSSFFFSSQLDLSEDIYAKNLGLETPIGIKYFFDEWIHCS